MWQRLIFGRTSVIRSLEPGPHQHQHRFHALQLEVADGIRLEGWVAEPLTGCEGQVLLYFGGRNENVAWAPKMCSHLGPWTVYAFNHRGMGQSDGRPSEAAAKADALRILQMVLRRAPHPKHLAVAGRSLGAAMALHVCAHAPTVAPYPAIRSLVLISPFDSLDALLRASRSLRALHPLVQRNFDNLSLAPRATVPTLMVLAEDDMRVPHAHSLRLAQHLPQLLRTEVIAATTHKTLPRHPATQRLLAAHLNTAL